MRWSSGALAITRGYGTYSGFHYDASAKVIAYIQQHLTIAKLAVTTQPVASQHRTAPGQTALIRTL